jgi:transposase
MRGNDQQQDGVFSYLSLEQRVPASHPLRAIRKLVDEALGELSPRFEELYASTGRPSIAPEKLLRALLLQALYGKRSERLLMEELDYSLLFRWFVGLAMDDAVWDTTVFSKNRDRLFEGEIASGFFLAVRGQLQRSGLLSDEHFTVDGTMLEAWAKRRSFQPKAEPPQRGSGPGGKRLLRDTHESRTDPEARLYRKCNAAAAQPSYLGHVLAENDHGLIVGACVTEAGTRAEREATRSYQGLPDIDYPFHDKTIVVTRCGRICLGNKKINFSQVFAGQAVGIKEVQDDIWLVSFMEL